MQISKYIKYVNLVCSQEHSRCKIERLTSFSNSFERELDPGVVPG